MRSAYRLKAETFHNHHGDHFCMVIDTEHWITIRWQKGNRYYVAELRQDLFGAWLLKRTWGSIDTHRGQTNTLYADNYDHALNLLRNLEKRRKARGYMLTD